MDPAFSEATRQTAKAAHIRLDHAFAIPVKPKNHRKDVIEVGTKTFRSSRLQGAYGYKKRLTALLFCAFLGKDNSKISYTNRIGKQENIVKIISLFGEGCFRNWAELRLAFCTKRGWFCRLESARLHAQGGAFACVPSRKCAFCAKTGE